MLIEYFSESDGQQRDVVLTVRPITEGLTGYYTCKSRQSNASVEVYTTLTNPLWWRTTPVVNYLPVGSFLPVISVLYADFSIGYQNLGSGFSYSLAFEPYSNETQPEMLPVRNQDNSSGLQILELLPDNKILLLSGRTSNLVGNNLTYLITGQRIEFDGQYQLNGKSA